MNNDRLWTYFWDDSSRSTSFAWVFGLSIQVDIYKAESFLNTNVCFPPIACAVVQINVWTLFWPRQENRVFEHAQKHIFRFIPRICKCHSGICFPLIHSLMSNDYVSGQRRPWSDCEDGQADLGLRCSHLPKDTFSIGAAHLITPRNKLTAAQLISEDSFLSDFRRTLLLESAVLKTF